MSLTLSGITHDYGTGPVLHGVDLAVQPGQVHALLGMNGAGKSTLVHIATGHFPPTAGRVAVDDRDVRFAGPGQAAAAGVVLLAQEVDRSLVPQLTVHENLTVTLRAGGGLFSPARNAARARELLARYDVDLDVTRQVASLSLFEKQVLCLVRAVAARARYLLLDEPTSAFDAAEVQRFYRIVRAVVADGLGVVFISHRLAEVFELADTITVLRDGRTVLTAPADAAPAAVVEAITGSLVAGQARSARRVPDGDVVSAGVVLSAGGFVVGRDHRTVDLELRGGEVLVAFGPLGAGKTSLARWLFGLHGPYDAALDGRHVRIGGPTDAVRHGVVLVPEERRRQGLWLDETTGTHLALGLRGLVRSRRELARAERLMTEFEVQPPEPGRLVRRLSGGNQQKVAFAKWGDEARRVVILDEPMTGVDVGAKESLFARIEAAADAGAAVLYLTSEPEDALRIADRVLRLDSADAAPVPAAGLTTLDLLLAKDTAA